MDETEEKRQVGPGNKEVARRRAKQRAGDARWNLDIAVFAFAVLIIVLILLFQSVRLEIVAPVAVVGLGVVWLAGWWQGRKLYNRFYEEELDMLERGEKTAEEKTMAETVEEMIQKALRDRWH